LVEARQELVRQAKDSKKAMNQNHFINLGLVALLVLWQQLGHLLPDGARAALVGEAKHGVGAPPSVVLLGQHVAVAEVKIIIIIIIKRSE
jgi:hypothetical protein